jgi:hypothetical protein
LGVCNTEGRRRHFYPSNEFDGKGVIGYLGTNLNASATYVNPSVRGFVNASRSLEPPEEFDSGDATCVLDREPAQCITGSMRNAWWMLDFTAAYRVQVTAYTLRDGFNDSRQFIQWFSLEGSNNKLLWDSLDDRIMDTNITENFGSHTYRIARTAAYRYFRVTQTDRNAGGLFYLSLSGIELYGTLFGTRVACAVATCWRDRDGLTACALVCDPSRSR